MPVTRLFVEGRLDAMLFNAVIAADNQSITIEEKGPKYGLLAKVLDERKLLGNESFFLRDRDFDFDVLPEIATPQPIKNAGNTVGWHCCRHEIENYLLEPAIIKPYLSLVAKRDVSVDEIQAAICQAALTIRFYQAARWTVGTAKRKSMLPPLHDLSTRATEEGKLPDGLDREQSLHWAQTSTAVFLKRVEDVLNEQVVLNRFQEFESHFHEEQCQDLPWVLHMFSGKDLFAALNDWFKSFGFQSAKDTTNKIAEWVTQHASTAIQAIPEWQSLLAEFKQA